MSTLKIFIVRKWFDMISNGEKEIEYRRVGPYWTSRLYDKNGKKKPFRYIEFINGYQTNAPRMITEYLGVSKRRDDYLIKIGKVLKRKNFK